MNQQDSSRELELGGKSRSVVLPLLALATFGVFLGSARAQQTPASTAPAGRRLSLSEATDLALHNNRNIQIAQAGVDRATADHEQARSAFWPQVLLGSGLAYTKGFPLSIEGSAPSIFQVNSSQAFFDKNLRGAEKQAGAMQDAAGKSLEETQDQVVAETALTYIDLDRSRRSLEYLRGQTANLESVAQITADRVAGGLEPPLETTRAELSTARSRSQIAALESQISLLDFRLKDLTGIPQSENIVTAEVQATALPADATLDALVASAINNYPGLKELDDEVRSKEFAVASQEGTRWPRVNLVGQYGLFSKINNYDQYFRTFARNNLTIGLSVVVPLYERNRYDAQLQQAETDLAQTRFRRDETRAAVSRQVREAWGAVQQQAAAREVSRLELELARKSLDAVLAQYDEGKVNRLAVEQARVEENRAWVSLLDADFQNEKSRLELLRLTGKIRTALP